jgi:hypothetical protein
MIDRSTKVYGSQVKQKIRATEASFFYKKKENKKFGYLPAQFRILINFVSPK